MKTLCGVGIVLILILGFLWCLASWDVWAQDQPDESAAPNTAAPPLVPAQPQPTPAGPEAAPVNAPAEPTPEAAMPEVPGQTEAAPPPAAPPPPMPARPALPMRPRMARPPVRPGERRAMPHAPGAALQPKAQPTTDNLPKNGGTPNEPSQFDFNDVPLTQVVESLAKMTGKNFDVDPQIASTHVTIITHDRIPPDMAYDVLAAVLNARGFNLVPTLDGHMIRIVQAGGENSGDKYPLDKGTGHVGKFDQVSTHIITIQHADAAELSTIVKELGSSKASVDAYARTNTLIITDTADGLNRMFEFIKEVDVPGFDTQMEIYTLVYARAEILANQIQEVLNETGAMPGQQRPGSMPAMASRMQLARPPVRPSVPGQSQSMVVGNRQEVLRIVPDERLNSLIVIATPGLLEKVRDLVAKLDTPTPYEANNLNVYKLLNAQADKVEKALQAIVGTAPRQSSGGAGGVPGVGGGGGMANTVGEVQAFEKKVVITKYEQSNALLILASPQDFKILREIIAQLDVPQRQVMVEAVIMDVSLQDTYGLTVDEALVNGKSIFGLGDTSNINSLVPAATTLASDLTSATKVATQISNGTLALGLAEQLVGLGQNGGGTVGAFQNLTYKVGSVKYKIPFVPFLLKALETLTDVDVLSQPTLTTQDNEEGNIVIGQEIPVPTVPPGYSYNPYATGTAATSTAQSQVPVYGMTSYGAGIDREDVGVKMKIKAHINEGDYVSMQTEIEVSEATQSDVGINANTLGPTFNKSKVTNNVVVKEGSTSVVGGLIKETVNHTNTKTPFLADIPLLGILFRTKNDTRKKEDVVVLLTPHIIKEGADADRLAKYKMDEFRDMNIDLLFDQGFIKKVKKSHHMNEEYWPSVDRSENMKRHGSGFARGDIERE